MTFSRSDYSFVGRRKKVFYSAKKFPVIRILFFIFAAGLIYLQFDIPMEGGYIVGRSTLATDSGYRDTVPSKRGCFSKAVSDVKAGFHVSSEREVSFSISGGTSKSITFSWPADIILNGRGNDSACFNELGFESWPVPELRFWGASDLPLRPISTGRVVYISAAGPDAIWVKLYHGRGLYSHYCHMNRVKEELLLGDVLNTSRITGYSGLSEDKTVPALSLRIEKNGVFINPLELLILPEDKNGGV